MRSLSRGVCLAVVFVSSSLNPICAALLDDHFNDGVIGTNTTGTGNGFLPYLRPNATMTETGSEAVFGMTGGTLQTLYSNDNLNLFIPSGTTTTYHVSGGSVAGNVPFDQELGGDNGRIWLGLVTDTTPTNNYALPLNSVPTRHGLWVSLYDTRDGGGLNQATLGAGTNPNDYNGQIGWVTSTGTRSILAQFTYDSYLLNNSAHNAIDVIMSVTDTTYAVSFAGPDSGVTLKNGAFSGSLPSAAVGTFKVAATIQSGGQVSLSSLEIDRITVEGVPEPGALVLISVGTMSFFCAGFRRKTELHESGED